jgi:hypothetical protein
MTPDVIAAGLFGIAAGLTGGTVWTYFLYRGAYKRGLFDGQLAAQADTPWPPPPITGEDAIRAMASVMYGPPAAADTAPDFPPSVYMTEQGARKGHEALDGLGRELSRVLADMEAERIAMIGDTEALIHSWKPAETPETPENPPPHIGNPF